MYRQERQPSEGHHESCAKTQMSLCRAIQKEVILTWRESDIPIPTLTDYCFSPKNLLALCLRTPFEIFFQSQCQVPRLSSQTEQLSFFILLACFSSLHLFSNCLNELVCISPLF